MNKERLVINFDKLDEFCLKNDFIIITDEMLIKERMKKNLVYASSDNFVGKPVYPENMPLLIEKGVWDKLVKINNELRNDNKCIIIYDGYRPLPIQQIFWDSFYETYGYNDETLVANPKKRGTHNIRINAVDIFIGNIGGSPIELPCEFDDFTGKANIHYSKCSSLAIANRDLLIKIANKYGLIVNESEWWHYTDERISMYGLHGNYSETNLVPRGEENVFILSTDCSKKII